MTSPRRLRVRMYQVGFGDCFLLSFEYARKTSGRSERHVLIDCGTNSAAMGVPMTRVVELIGQHCGGKLDAVVLSHRHRDHMSAFGAEKTAQMFDRLEPSLVVRPWTEDPDRPAKARSFLSTIDRAQAFAEQVEERIAPDRRGVVGELRSFAAAQVKNKASIKKLNDWAKNGRAEYLSVGGTSSELAKLLPGVRTHVLGPPTVDQWPQVLRERQEDQEYWLRFGASVRTGAISFEREMEELSGPGDLETESGDIAKSIAPGPVLWLLQRMRRQQVFGVYRLVRLLDDVLNNTSLILLFEFGQHHMLFGGDAEIQNWEYVLAKYSKRQAVIQALKNVDLYKVGHHGSRNATPKIGLYGLWDERPKGDLTSIVSTKEGVYPGKTDATRVPRASLLRGLRKRGLLVSSHEFPKKREFIELVADADRRGFRRA